MSKVRLLMVIVRPLNVFGGCDILFAGPGTECLRLLFFFLQEGRSPEAESFIHLQEYESVQRAVCVTYQDARVGLGYLHLRYVEMVVMVRKIPV